MKIFNRFTLWIILASATLTVMAGSILAPVLNLIREGLGVDSTSVGLIITTHALFIAIFSPIIGNLIDRIGTKKPFIFGLVLYGLSGGSGLFITSYWVLIISRAILGIAVASIFISIWVMILNLYKGIERDKIMGWRGSANSFGGIIFPLIGGFLGTISWQLPFAVYLLGIPMGFFALITIPDIQKLKTQEAGKESSVLMIFRNKPFLFAIYGLMFSGMVLLYTNVVFLPQLLEKNFNISDPRFISIFISIMMLSAGITATIYHKIKSKLTYKKIFLITLALWSFGFFAISQASFVLIIIASVMLFGIGQGMIAPAIMVWIGETVDISFRGRIISYLATFGFLGQFLSPIIWSPISLFFGFNEIFLVAGGVCALLFLLFLIGMRK